MGMSAASTAPAFLRSSSALSVCSQVNSGLGAAEVAVGGRLPVDRPAQVQVLDDPAGVRAKCFAHELGDPSVGHLPVPSVSTMIETGSATPMA